MLVIKTRALKNRITGLLSFGLAITTVMVALIVSNAAIAKDIKKMPEADPEIGKYIGAKTATHPSWFKESFLDLDEDIADAAESNKRLVLYFWQPGCPYCNQLWEDNFSQKTIEDKFRKNFEIVAINMWGDREVINVSGRTFTEKALSSALSIKYTPTLLFFNENKKVIHRLNGYIPPEDFKRSLEYVSGKYEAKLSFGEYSSQQKEQSINPVKKQSTALNQEDFFSIENTDLTSFDKEYLAVFIEEANCKNCDLLHHKTLQNPVTRKLVKQFESVQFNRYSNKQITTPLADKTTVKQWADKLGLSYLPAIIFFDSNKKEVMRIDAQMRSFHMQSVFDYVLSGAYKTEKNFQRYISARADKIREKGIDVDIWAY